MSEIIIRDKKRLKQMGETGDALKMIVMKSDGSLQVPIIYRFGKNVSQYMMDNEQPIGVATNLHIDNNTGDLVGNVQINHFVKNAKHYDSEIDNCIVKKAIDNGIVSYDISCFVVYNKDAKRENQRKAKLDNVVKKNYNVPEQVMDVDPRVGDALLNKLKAAHKTLNDVTGTISSADIDKMTKEDVMRAIRKGESK